MSFAQALAGAVKGKPSPLLPLPPFHPFPLQQGKHVLGRAVSSEAEMIWVKNNPVKS